MIYTERLAFYLVEILFASRYFGGIISCRSGTVVVVPVEILCQIFVLQDQVPLIISGITGCPFAFFFSRRRDITRNRCRYSYNSSFENLFCYVQQRNIKMVWIHERDNHRWIIMHRISPKMGRHISWTINIKNSNSKHYELAYTGIMKTTCIV